MSDCAPIQFGPTTISCSPNEFGSYLSPNKRLRLRCVGFIHTMASLPIPRDVECEEDQVCADGRSDDCSDEGEKSAGRIEPQPGTCEATS